LLRGPTKALRRTTKATLLLSWETARLGSSITSDLLGPTKATLLLRCSTNYEAVVWLTSKPAICLSSDTRGTRRRRHNLAKVLAANEGEVLLHGELWRSGDREILINWEKKQKKKISKLIPRKLNFKEKKILINGEK